MTKFHGIINHDNSLIVLWYHYHGIMVTLSGYHGIIFSLKGQCYNIFHFQFFHQTIPPPLPLIHRLKIFEFCFEFAEIWSIFERKIRACEVNDNNMKINFLLGSPYKFIYFCRVGVGQSGIKMFLIDIPIKGCQGRSNHSMIVYAVSYFAYGVNDTAWIFNCFA
jgi:hypothetical protein